MPSGGAPLPGPACMSCTLLYPCLSWAFSFPRIFSPQLQPSNPIPFGCAQEDKESLLQRASKAEAEREQWRQRHGEALRKAQEDTGVLSKALKEAEAALEALKLDHQQQITILTGSKVSQTYRNAVWTLTAITLSCTVCLVYCTLACPSQGSLCTVRWPVLHKGVLVSLCRHWWTFFFKRAGLCGPRPALFCSYKRMAYMGDFSSVGVQHQDPSVSVLLRLCSSLTFCRPRMCSACKWSWRSPRATKSASGSVWR